MPDLTWLEENWKGLAVAASCVSLPLLWALVFYTVRGHIHAVRASLQSLEEHAGRTQRRNPTPPSAYGSPRGQPGQHRIVIQATNLGINERIHDGHLERWAPFRGWHTVNALEERNHAQ